MSDPTNKPDLPTTVIGPVGSVPNTQCLPPIVPAGADFPSVPGYEIESELGRGGMGVVYKARQTSLHRTVALKMILAGAHAGAEAKRRFRTEAEAVARLSHPNIVQVHEIGENEGCPYFSLEFVEGGSLDRRLRAGPMKPEDAVVLLETLARAMHHAHLHGVIHRDLKPANILLAATDTGAKITDFGLAKQLEVEGQTQSGTVLGTPSYMAPEQASGKSKGVGPLADVYALGAILYECLTGRPPFQGESTMDTLLKVLEQVPQRPRYFNRHIDSGLEAICLKCLEKEPTQRYPSALALADDLAAYRQGQSILAEQGSNLALFRALWQESRHTEVLRLSGRTWMAQAVVIFLVMLYASIMQWGGVQHPLAYLPAAVVGMAGMIVAAWWFRLRNGPPMTTIEWQTAKILFTTLTAIAVTVAINFIRGYGPMELFPMAVLEAGVGMGAVGILLGGSLNFMPFACIIVALLLAWKPEAGPILFGTVFGVAMFIQGYRYTRRT